MILYDFQEPRYLAANLWREEKRALFSYKKTLQYDAKSSQSYTSQSYG